MAVRQRQRGYLSRTEGVRAKADGQAKWKESHHTRRHLIEMGLVRAVHSGGQVTSLFLTEQGDATARAIVGRRLRSPDDATKALAVLLTMKRDSDKQFGGEFWASESTILGEPLSGDPSEWDRMTELFLPLLVRGLVTASSDLHGRVFYSPRGTNLPEEIEVDQSADPAADDAYVDAYQSERATLKASEYEGSEIEVPIPMGW